MPTGHPFIVQRALSLELFSSIVDYVQQVLPASGDATTNAYDSLVSEVEGRLTKGARVVVAFLSGDSSAPVIVGCLPHEYSPVILDQPSADPGDEPPETGIAHKELAMKLNGIVTRITSQGEFHLIHEGVTKVVQNAPFAEIKIEEPDDSERSRLSIGKGGVLEYVDSEGQSLSVNPVLGFVSLDTPNSSFVLTKKGNATMGLSGDYNVGMKGNRKVTIQKNDTLNVQGEQKIEVSKGVEWKVGALTVKFDPAGKMSFANQSGLELLQLLIETLQTLSITTAPGFHAPLSTVAQFSQLQAKLTSLKA